MRIVGGIYRGKKLFSPQNTAVRPTSERAREAIFNILYSHLGGNYENMVLADIFAGTGAFGFEAISRGMQHVTFVDQNTETVERNAKMFDKERDKFAIIKANALNLPRLNRNFDIIFMDAPYAQGLSQKVLSEIITKNWLKNNGICIVEVNKNEVFDLIDGFEFIDTRIYGIAKILFLQKK